MKKLILPTIIAAPLAVSPIGVFAADVAENCVINGAGNKHLGGLMFLIGSIEYV